MSHYPNSAELASFRRAIKPVVPVSLGWVAWLPTSDRDGAWSHELGHGIGWSRSNTDYLHAWTRLPGGRVVIAAESRQEANDMRRRAYIRDLDDTRMPYLPRLDMLAEWGSYFAPWAEEIRFGAPYTFHAPADWVQYRS